MGMEAREPDPALETRIDGIIDRIGSAAARDPDGYINTYTQMREPGHRWGQNERQRPRAVASTCTNIELPCP